MDEVDTVNKGKTNGYSFQIGVKVRESLAQFPEGRFYLLGSFLRARQVYYTKVLSRESIGKFLDKWFPKH